MALDGNKTGCKVADLITAASVNGTADVKTLWQKIVTTIFNDITSDIEITVPSGTVIVKVAGQATGTANPAPIKNEVS